MLISICFIAAFGLFSYWISHGAMKTADFSFTVKIQERIDTSSRLRLSHFIGEIMEGSTFFASPVFSSVVVMLLSIIACARERGRRRWWLLLGIPVLFLAIVFVEIYAKSVVHHPAPPYFMIKNPTTIFPKYYINDQYSYPSGHTARAIFIGILLYSVFCIQYSRLIGWSPERRHYSVFKSKKLKIIVVMGIVGYVSLVAISRIYLGHHWLSDIMGGGFLGGGFGFLALSLLL